MEGRTVSRSNDVWDAGLRLVALLWLWDLARVCAFQEKASKQDSQARAQSVVVACGFGLSVALSCGRCTVSEWSCVGRFHDARLRRTAYRYKPPAAVWARWLGTHPCAANSP